MKNVILQKSLFYKKLFLWKSQLKNKITIIQENVIIVQKAQLQDKSSSYVKFYILWQNFTLVLELAEI